MGHSSRSVSLSRRAALQPPVRDRLCTSRVPTRRHANRERALETYREDTGSTSHLQNHLSFPSGESVPGSTRAAQLRPPDERPPRTLPPWWRDWWRDGVHAVVNTYSSTHWLANTCLGQTRGGQEQSRSPHKVARTCLQQVHPDEIICDKRRGGRNQITVLFPSCIVLPVSAPLDHDLGGPARC